MKKLTFSLIAIFISITSIAQNSEKAEKLLNEVSQKMGSYKTMKIDFASSLSNESAGITNEAPIKGKIILSGEKYNLEYLGNIFIFDGKKLVVINKEEEEVSITNGDLEEEDGFIYPSKLFTFYKEGYTYQMGKKEKHIQFVELTPIDSHSEIVKVLLAINMNTKHIFKLIQIGSNGTKTMFKINKLRVNTKVTTDAFNFDKQKYLKMGYLID